MNRGHFPSDEAVIKLPKAGDLRHLWTNEPENATRTKDCQHPSAGPRASSSKDRSPPTGTRPWPSSPPPTPTESTPTCKTLTQKTGQAPGTGGRSSSGPLPNDEERLRAVYKKLADHGNLLVVVDQPATIGALAVAVAQDMGITVGYLPGLSMRRIADLTPGSAKTDAKDAAVIAGAARTMPHTLRAINASDEDAAALSMLTGFDLDLARQVNQSANRIRGLYTQIHPALEAVVGPWLEHDAILEVIAAWPTPADLKRAGRTRIDAKLKAHGCRRHTTWAG